MTDVSGTLRAERERAGFTLEEISSRTKIKVAFLRAIERGNFEQLPGEFFARAFLRTYARELRLSPDQIVAAYDGRHTPATTDIPAPDTPAAPASVGVSPRPSEPAPALRTFALPTPRSIWPTLLLAAAVLTVVVLMNRTIPDAPAEDAVGTSGVAEPAAPAATVPPAVARPEKLTIDIRPSRVMWVAGMADGKRVIYRLVEPGEHVRIDAHKDLWFRVGDAGAFVYSLNGSPDKPLGASGEVREFKITHENYRTFNQ